VVPPYARDLVDERLRRVRVGPDILQREVRRNVGRHQGREGDGDQQELYLRRRHRDRHQLLVAGPCPPQREHRLHDGHRKAEDQRIVAGLCDHGPEILISTLLAPCGAPACASPRQTPCSFSFLATSGGMYFSSCLASTLLARNTPSALSLPSATTPWPSRNRSGSTPVYVTGSVARLSVTTKLTVVPSPRFKLPLSTSPPSRNRWPAPRCFSATSDGV